ncbi:MAG: Stk1 family PASTA domain-containing Ser/Thr kinase [Anaerostipes sp.]|nr:Stk1 family PASTA domain-containing Ser/Thr kinase [Anaerostipes sp.]
MLETGSLLSGRYEILKHIGAGGMAEVFMAKDRKLNRYVAVKVLKKDFLEDEKILSKFKVEAQAVAGLNCSNIVNVYDVGVEGDVNYIIMELVDGLTLKEYIRRVGKLSSKETVDVTIQIAKALQCAHANHTIHRDIKPQNIIISETGGVKVTDFGIAKVASSNTVTSTAIGSAHYISPEQAKGKFCDEKSDIYSLGITMYEMVTGQLPFDHENGITVALMHLQNEITPPSALVEDIPESLEKIILKCTMKKPEERYQSAQELIADLQMVFDDISGEYVGVAPIVDNSPTIVLSGKELDDAQEHSGYVDDSSDDDEGNGMSAKMERLVVILAAVVGAIIIIAIVVFVINGSGLFKSGTSTTVSATTETEKTTEKPKQIAVENYVGITYYKAKEMIGSDLKIERKSETSDDYDEGVVIRQSIESNTEVDKGTTIVLTVSSGQSTIEVPNVVGYSQTSATKTLSNKGFKVSVTTENSSDVKSGEVISQSPKGGTRRESGSTITITVSKGESLVSVPDLRYESLSSAKAELKAAGLKLGSISKEYNDVVDQNCVIRQSIASGKEVSAGTAVGIVVSLGPQATDTVGTTEE